MPVPQAVAEQGKIADEMFKAQFVTAGDTNAPPATVTPTVTPAPAPTDTPPAPVAVSPATQQVAAHQAQPTTEDSLETWKQRFSTLQGKYNAEVPRLSYRVAYLENQIDDLQKQLTTARETPPVNPAEPAVMTVPATTGNIGQMLTTSEEPTIKAFREQYPDVAQAVAKIVDQAAANTQANFESRFKTVEQDRAKTAQDRFMANMSDPTTGVPEWQATCQQDPNWPVWLSQRDRYANKTRGEILKDALASFDSTSVVNMIKDYRSIFQTVTPPAEASPGITSTVLAAPAPPAPTNPRAGAITPPSGPPGVPPGIQPKQLISRKDISEFYANVAKGLYRGQEALRQQIDAEINAAQREGRVV